MLNKILSILIAISFLGFAAPTNADTDIGKQYMIGVGVGGGSLTYGLAGKLHLDADSAIIASLGGNYGFSFDAGYVQRIATIWDGGSNGQLDLAVGAAAMGWLFNSGIGSEMIFGGRGVIELAYKFNNFPLEVTAEWGPSFLTGTGVFSGLYLAGGGGAVRWFF